MKVVVVDYGMGNVRSVLQGIEKVGSKAQLSEIPEDILNADRVVFPGVGAFGDGMEELRKRRLDTAIKDYARTGRPLLGICVAMQLFFDESEEHGIHEGLGLISGNIVRIPEDQTDQKVRKIPHVGWNSLAKRKHNQWNGTLLEGLEDRDSCYFVHSYMAAVSDEADILAECEYEGLIITAAVHRDNITGLQFHPEKSGIVGLQILKNFLR